jgi:hypothetical protein
MHIVGGFGAVETEGIWVLNFYLDKSVGSQNMDNNANSKYDFDHKNNISSSYKEPGNKLILNLVRSLPLKLFDSRTRLITWPGFTVHPLAVLHIALFGRT